jgi:hypothetical protein
MVNQHLRGKKTIYLRQDIPAVLGGCIVYEGMPEYECKACGLQLRKLSFPRNPRRLAELALNEEWADGVEYVGIYRKKAVYRPKVKEGYCW